MMMDKVMEKVSGMMPKVLDQGLPKASRPIYAYNQMKCYWCDTELIIGGDIDIEEGMNGYPSFR